MPELGEIQKGQDISKRGPRHVFMWTACIGCEKERWVRYIAKSKRLCNLKCRSCALRKGREDIYRYAHLSHQDPLYPMAKQNDSRVLEHRLVMARHLGRCLTPDEIVHHLNGIKSDNQIENLYLTTQKEHHAAAFARLKNRIQELELKLRIKT